jgi:hypothetical protein
MTISRFSSLLLLTWLSFDVMAAGPEPRNLQHDPFVRPAFAMPAVANNPASAANAATGGLPDKLPFELLSVINAGSRSLVNAGGKFIKLQEKIEGYQLVSVGNGKAVFVKDGVRLEAEISMGMKK